jgi:hypothetical protein
MAVTNHFPEPLQNALREAMQKAIEEAGHEALPYTEVQFKNAQFGEVTLHLDETRD